MHVRQAQKCLTLAHIKVNVINTCDTQVVIYCTNNSDGFQLNGKRKQIEMTGTDSGDAQRANAPHTITRLDPQPLSSLNISVKGKPRKYRLGACALSP